MVVLGTVTDGDCGSNVWCQMLGWNETAETSLKLRTELSGYLIEHWKTPWMHDLLVATAEIDLRDVQRYREADDAAPPLPSPGQLVVDTINIDDLPEDTVAGPPTPADLPPTPSDLPELAAPPTPRDTSGCKAAVAVGEQCEIEQALAWAMSCPRRTMHCFLACRALCRWLSSMNRFGGSARESHVQPQSRLRCQHRRNCSSDRTS